MNEGLSEGHATRGGRAGRARRSRSLLGWLWAGIVSVWRLTFGVAKLTALTLFVMALVGYVSYRVMLKYVQGETVSAPLLVGKGLDEALLLLGESRLTMELEKEEAAEKQPPGVVLNQYPLPNTPIKVGSPVRVVLSLGPAVVAVPDVRGLGLKEAEIQLEQADLKRGARAAMESQSVREGSVISSDPAPGGRARRGQEVNLLVSSGPPRRDISVPLLVGKSLDEAQALTSRMGLSLTSQAAEGAPITDRGVVVRQYPQAGEPIEDTSAIVVQVR